MKRFYGFKEYIDFLYFEMKNSDVKCLGERDSLSLLYGGISEYLSDISSSDIILIKTSVTGKRDADHEIRPNFLSGIIESIRCIAPQNKIFLCDGPAYETSLYREYKRLGWERILIDYDIDVMDLNYGDVTYLDGLWPVSSVWINAAKVINMCKAKTHGRLGVSLASKNLIGTLSGSRMGFPKLYSSHVYLQRIIDLLLDIRANTYNIIDGYQGIEGNGPMRGRIANSNFIVYGSNTLLCDVRAMIEMGFHPAATQYAIMPFCLNKHRCECDIGDDKLGFFRDMRKSDFNYLPHFAFPWMYKSLYYDRNRLKKIYYALLDVNLDNWNNYLKRGERY